jgi:kynureninase
VNDSRRDNPEQRLLAYRDRFPILKSTVYLISNSLGAMPEEASRALAEYAEAWGTRGVRAWEEGWWELAQRVGDLVAPLIGARSGEVVFQPNVPIAHAVIFSGVEPTAGRRRIVSDALHFPSILYLIEQMGRAGFEPVIIPSDDGVTIDTQRLVDAIDEGTASVAVSHISYKSSYIYNISAIAEKARAVGAWLVVDGYQAVGSIPVDARAMGVDVYIGGCLKWLCGGPGAAFVWVDPDRRRQLAPRVTGWMAHRRPFGFEPTLDRREDAWRFLHGTPNISALYAARPGLEIVNEAGIDAIRAKSIRQTARLVELARQNGWPCRVPTETSKRGGTVVLDVPHGLEVSRALKERDILCDFRPGAGIRLAPHFYTRDDELGTAIESIAEIERERSWRDFAGMDRHVS